MAISQVPPLSSNVPIVYPPGHPSAGCPTPAFATLMQILLDEKAITDALAQGAIQPGTVTTSGLTAAAQRILGNKEATTGAIEELTVTEALDLIAGTAAQGDIFYRGATSVKRLAAGTSGQFLKTLGAGADPAWGTAGASLRGALVKKAADQTGINATSGFSIAWDAEVYDTASIHDNATNNTRLTVPSGVTYVRLCGSVRLNNVAANSYISVAIFKNGSASYSGAAAQQVQSALLNPPLNVSTAPLPVVAGDYFELTIFSQTDTSIDLEAARSSFAMEIIA